jgi:hypothetical protein
LEGEKMLKEDIQELMKKISFMDLYEFEEYKEDNKNNERSK